MMMMMMMMMLLVVVAVAVQIVYSSHCLMFAKKLRIQSFPFLGGSNPILEFGFQVLPRLIQSLSYKVGPLTVIISRL